ncbi:MAG: hypothetical protein IPM51_16245 [Sphingobacteriaceae bacterium]|nr:hypothetical protein [Sphingobacteriaceae bacterium]
MKVKKKLLAALGFIALTLSSCQETEKGQYSKLSSQDSSSTYECSSVITGNKNEKSINSVTSPNLLIEKMNSLAQLKKRTRKKASHFVIKTNRDTILKCKEGTLLAIPAQAFLNSSTLKPITGQVKISVKEFYKISDMIMAGLSTKSYDQLLETGGMILIQGLDKLSNDSCILSPGKNIAIAMPQSSTASVDRMQLFNGVRDNNIVNWVPGSSILARAQRWRSGGGFFPQSIILPDAGLPFTNEGSKLKPLNTCSKKENLQAQMKIPLRELLYGSSIRTKKVSAYIDTSGNLICYKTPNTRNSIKFNEIYNPIISQNLKVNVAVEVKLNYKSHLNQDYYQKLLKMGKCNADSLIATTVTLNPNAKLIDYEKAKKYLNNVVTIDEYKIKQRRNFLINEEYEKNLKRLRLENEEKLSTSEGKEENLQNAKNYFLLNTTKLGWINCDKFNSTPNRVDYYVKVKENESVLIVFDSLKSIVNCDPRGFVGNAPLNEKITIVGLKTENGQLKMAIHQTSISKEPFEGLTFESVSVSEYKRKLEKLNKQF